MVKRGIIRKIIYDWVSNMVVVRKKNNDLRICIDLIHLNRQIKRPHYMLPTLEQILSVISVIFSCFFLITFDEIGIFEF